MSDRMEESRQMRGLGTYVINRAIKSSAIAKQSTGLFAASCQMSQTAATANLVTLTSIRWRSGMATTGSGTIALSFIDEAI